MKKGENALRKIVLRENVLLDKMSLKEMGGSLKISFFLENRELSFCAYEIALNPKDFM